MTTLLNKKNLYILSSYWRSYSRKLTTENNLKTVYLKLLYLKFQNVFFFNLGERGNSSLNVLPRALKL